MSPPRSKADWKARIEPHLSTSLQTVSEKIMRTDTVQRWLRKASMEAASELGNATGLQGEMKGYRQMMNALEDRFPELLGAVHELTDGHGRVELHWRPTNPNFTRLYVAFDRDYSVTVFVRLAEPTPEAARSVLQTVSDALPEGDPYPNRPNTATGLVAFEGRCLGVRVSERMGKDGDRRDRTVTLLPNDRTPIERLSPEVAVDRLLQLLAGDSSASS